MGLLYILASASHSASITASSSLGLAGRPRPLPRPRPRPRPSREDVAGRTGATGDVAGGASLIFMLEPPDRSLIFLLSGADSLALFRF